ncbi:hypothetical protein [Chenggangzhangella methanolivorans]|uniref:Uncharacterized protein n=1 Tax=Chenggangzhangella methanolivorans TaxID=1437009 RepID=A0A9E6RCC6_9HYPH|nr:hypothetical protein [Chenggangzhangella methanolivorans]QZO00699.1 hypothetical protein K6K41_03055 [Chenggangzhangella methanolivorans]
MRPWPLLEISIADDRSIPKVKERAAALGLPSRDRRQRRTIMAAAMPASHLSDDEIRQMWETDVPVREIVQADRTTSTIVRMRVEAMGLPARPHMFRRPGGRGGKPGSAANERQLELDEIVERLTRARTPRGEIALRAGVGERTVYNRQRRLGLR